MNYNKNTMNVTERASTFLSHEIESHTGKEQHEGE